MRRDRFVSVGVLLAVVLGCIGVALGLYRLGYRVNLSASHPIGFYRIVEREPAIGLYALFCIPVPLSELPPVDKDMPPCTRDTAGYPVLKRIVRIDAERGEYYVLGDHPRSLDSRIFGPLGRSDITSVAVVVWVFQVLPWLRSYAG